MFFFKILFLKVYLLGLIPKNLISKEVEVRILTGKIFYNNKKIKKSKNKDYYYLYPMPKKDELLEFYENNYWESINKKGKDQKVNKRDREHFSILKKNAEVLFSKPIRVLNFGAGHGGISHLFWQNNCSVVNVEISKMKKEYEERWEHFTDIDQIPINKKFDLIYGSHAIEHLNNIELFYKKIESLLKPKGFIFWEVPNGSNPQNGGCNGKICAPHTYYFKKSYFDSIPNFKVISNKFYDENNEETENELKADVIRYLGMKD